MMPWHRTGQTGPAPSDDRVKGKPLFPPLPDDPQAENRNRIHEVLKDFGAHVIQLSLALDGYLTGALSRADAQAEAGEALARFTQIAQSRIKEKMVECDDARMQTAMALSTARQRIAALERENAELRAKPIKMIGAGNVIPEGYTVTSAEWREDGDELFGTFSAQKTERFERDRRPRVSPKKCAHDGVVMCDECDVRAVPSLKPRTFDHTFKIGLGGGKTQAGKAKFDDANRQCQIETGITASVQFKPKPCDHHCGRYEEVCYYTTGTAKMKATKYLCSGCGQHMATDHVSMNTL